MILKFLTRFSEMRRIYVGDNISPVCKVYYYVDWFLSYLIHGASISDYFAYGFYKLRYNGRKEYITYRRHYAIQKKCNNLLDTHLCRDKDRFNEYFKDFLGRTWIDVNDTNESCFVAFCSQNPVVFIKETNGYCGIGTRKIETGKLNLKGLYAELIADKVAHYIVEEPITQISDLMEFHPWSINTVRIVTVYDTANDEVHIMSATLRMGNKKNSLDNYHFDGISASINIETGIIVTMGYDAYNRAYVTHPLSGKQIVGFQMPNWKECKCFVIRAARKIPTVKYIGWDVVIQEGKCFSLIEGNDNAGHDIQQLHNCGLWKQYSSIIKNF